MGLHDRLGSALTSIATATSVQRARAYDVGRNTRNGRVSPDAGLEARVVKLEAMAAELWDILEMDERRHLRKAA